jgi:hypothetical protein
MRAGKKCCWTIEMSGTLTLEEAEKLVRAFGQCREAWGAFEVRVGEKMDRLERNEPSGLTADEREELQRLSHESAKSGDDLMFALCGQRPTLEMLRKLDLGGHA